MTPDPVSSYKRGCAVGLFVQLMVGGCVVLEEDAHRAWSELVQNFPRSASPPPVHQIDNEVVYYNFSRSSLGTTTLHKFTAHHSDL